MQHGRLLTQSIRAHWKPKEKIKANRDPYSTTLEKLLRERRAKHALANATTTYNALHTPNMQAAFGLTTPVPPQP